MDDRDFFDTLYQGWAKTTGAENTFWMPEEDTGYYVEGPGTYNIYAVDENQKRTDVAGGLSEADAAFITAIHGCFGDLVKRLHDALDEAERMDLERDHAMAQVFELSIRVMELEQELEDAKSK